MPNYEPTEDNSPVQVDSCFLCERREGSFMCGCGGLVCDICHFGSQCHMCLEADAYDEDYELDMAFDPYDEDYDYYQEAFEWEERSGENDLSLYDFDDEIECNCPMCRSNQEIDKMSEEPQDQYSEADFLDPDYRLPDDEQKYGEGYSN